MSVKTLRAFSKLIRIEDSLFSASGVILSGLLAGDLNGLQLGYLVAFLIVFLSSVGSFAVNDYFDLETDIGNRRYDRPLVTKLLPKRVASITGLVSISSVFLLSLLLNLQAKTLVLGSLPLFFLYSLGLKRIVLIKNILIAYAYLATIIFGAIVCDAVLEPLIIYFAAMGFIVGLAFEIILDIGDVEGDKIAGIETLASKFGAKIAVKASVILFGIIMILDPLPFYVLIDTRLYLDYVFLFLIFIPVFSYFFMLRSLINDHSKETILQLKKRIVKTMLVGCVVYLIGVLF